MFVLNGKYGEAKIFADSADEESISQVISLLNQPFVEGEKVRMMPDIHAGAGCTIGTTITVTDKICPNLVGVDIGCGMLAVRLKEKDINFKDLDETIRRNVPSGFSIRTKAHKNADSIDLSQLKCVRSCNTNKGYLSIGTLGGGNHFIEVDKDSEGHLWLVIHSGSRHMGLEVASYYQKAAVMAITSADPMAVDDLILAFRKEHREKEIQSALKTLGPKYSNVPKSLCWLEGQLFGDYVHDMALMQRYADLNRRTMAEVIITGLHPHAKETFTTTHNYLDVGHKILRKGSVSAQEGEKLLIPMNMRDGSLICTGKGNPDWNYSAPHGAGRLMSRSAAKEALSMKEYREEMAGIWTTSVSRATIDESPMAYKPMEEIIRNIGETAEIVDIIKPVYNFKAGEE